LKVTRCLAFAPHHVPSGRGFHSPSANASGVGSDDVPKVIASFGRLGFARHVVLLAEQRASLTVETVPWNLLSRLAESSPSSDVRCHGSVDVRRCPSSSRQPLPVSASAPRRTLPRRRVEGVSSMDTPDRPRTPRLARPEAADRLVPRRPSSCRSRVALSRARATPALRMEARWLSYDPVVRFLHGLFGPSWFRLLHPLPRSPSPVVTREWRGTAS
jgi:hypothetical protein